MYVSIYSSVHVELQILRRFSGVLGRLNEEMGEFLGLLRFKSQVLPRKMGPMSRIFKRTKHRRSHRKQQWSLEP